MERITSPITKQGQSSHNYFYTGFASRIKTLIVTLALWGLIPYRLADWMIWWGGLRNV